MRTDDNVVIMDHEIANGSRRHVEPEWLPLAAIVEGEVDGTFGPGEQQPAPDRIFADRVHNFIRRNSIDDLRPAFSAIVRPIDVRMQIVELESVDRCVRGFVIEVRRLQLRDLAPRSQRGWCDVCPRFSAIAREVDYPVVGTRPDRVYVPK